MCRHLYPIAPLLVMLCYLIALSMILTYLAKNHPKIWDSFFDVAGKKVKFELFDVAAQLRIFKFILFSQLDPLPGHRRLNERLYLFRIVFVVLLITALLFFARQPVEEFCA